MNKSIKQVISEAVEPARFGVSVNSKIEADTRGDELSMQDQRILRNEGLAKRIETAAKKVKAKTYDMIETSMGDLLDGVDGMMNIGDGVMKPTMSLNRIEFERVINVREEQLINDTKKLRKLRQLYVYAMPAWSNPEDQIGQCLKAIAANDNAPHKAAA